MSIDRRTFVSQGAVAAASVWLARHSVAAAAPRRSPLGINLSVIADYSTEFPFADLMRYTSPWVPQADGAKWGDGEPLEFAADGRTIQRLKKYQYATLVACEAGGQPEGRYRCTYQGRGLLQFSGTSRIVGGKPGDLEVNIWQEPEEGVLIHLRDTDPADPVRNIKIMMPGTADDAIFTPRFMQRCRHFRVVRFMDWMRINNSPVQKWAQRAKVTDHSFVEGGVPIEYMVQLANETACDPWFCVPHQAEDSYVESFAQYLKQHLNPERRAYVEYSNEVWNHMFRQAHYAAERGRDLGLSRNSFHAEMLYYAKRSVEVFKICKRILGQGSQGGERLTCVLGSQHANPWVTEEILPYENTHRHVDALAVAPYFGHEIGSPDMAEKADQLTVDDILERCAAEFAEVRKLTAQHRRWCKKFDVPLIAYEGGQHLVGIEGAENNQQLTALLIAANRDPRMRVLYKRHLRDWKEEGGQLYALYNSMGAPNKFGSWGLLENELQDPMAAPKYRAALEFIEENPQWWN